MRRVEQGRVEQRRAKGNDGRSRERSDCPSITHYCLIYERRDFARRGGA